MNQLEGGEGKPSEDTQYLVYCVFKEPKSLECSKPSWVSADAPADDDAAVKRLSQCLRYASVALASFDKRNNRNQSGAPPGSLLRSCESGG